jgi:hypothetical protein
VSTTPLFKDSHVTLQHRKAPIAKEDVTLLFLVPTADPIENTETHTGIHTASATAIAAANVLHGTRTLIFPFLNFMGVF